MMLLTVTYFSSAGLLTGSAFSVILGSFWVAHGQTLRPITAHPHGAPRRLLLLPLTDMWSCSADMAALSFLVILGSFWVAHGQTLRPIQALPHGFLHRWLMTQLIVT